MNLFLAVTTKYLGPTDNKGARIKATFGSESHTIPYHANLNPAEAHQEAAFALLNYLKITFSELKGGEIKDGYAFIVIE